MDFPPILVLAIIWLLIGLPLSRLNKVAKQQQAAKNAKSGAAKTGAKAPKTEPRMSGPAQPEVSPARPTVLQPTITFTEHDDSVYQGSLNAVTGEGFDPCHDEQLSPLSAAEREAFGTPFYRIRIAIALDDHTDESIRIPLFARKDLFSVRPKRNRLRPWGGGSRPSAGLDRQRRRPRLCHE